MKGMKRLKKNRIIAQSKHPPILKPIHHEEHEGHEVDQEWGFKPATRDFFNPCTVYSG